MKEWKVTYQDMPFAYNNPHVLIVEAETQEDARLTAKDYLIRRGFAVGRDTLIREVEAYASEHKGRVLEAL